MEWHRGYRLFEVGKDGNPKTLYHTHNGSRTLPLDTPLKAPKKQVWNPGMKTGPGYNSGWHVFSSRAKAEKYLTAFVKPRTIVVAPVQYANSKNKPRSRAEVYLARYMKINSKSWKKAKEV